MQQVGRMPPAGKPLGSVRRQGIPHLLPLIHDLQRKAVEVILPSAVSRSWHAWQNPTPSPKIKVGLYIVASLGGEGIDQPGKDAASSVSSS